MLPRRDSTFDEPDVVAVSAQLKQAAVLGVARFDPYRSTAAYRPSRPAAQDGISPAFIESHVFAQKEGRPKDRPFELVWERMPDRRSLYVALQLMLQARRMQRGVLIFAMAGVSY